MQTKILLENQKPVRASETSIPTVFWIVLITLFLTVITVYADGPVMPGQAPGAAGSVAAPITGGGAGAPIGTPQQSPFGMMMPILIMFGVVYFLMIRPQQKKVKE